MKLYATSRALFVCACVEVGGRGVGAHVLCVSVGVRACVRACV